MKSVFTLLLLTFTLHLQSQSFADFVDYVENLTDPVDRQFAVDSFLTENPTSPFYTSTQATILYQGSAADVEIAGDHTSWGPSAMSALSTTDLWYLTEDFPDNARVDYKVIVDGDWILDPLNPFEVWGGFGPNSELAMPGYIQPWEINFNPGIEHGTIEEFDIMSTNLNAEHSIQVYLPPSYDTNTDRNYPSLYMHDGHEYVDLASGANILDNLIDQGLISELIVVFVRPNNRESEYAFNKREEYRLFIAEEMVDYIDANYRTVKSPVARGVAGTSFGGNISALIAYNHPDVFGKMGIHSGAFWPNNHEALDLWLDNPVVDVQVASVFGSYENSIFVDMNLFHDEMTALGYEIYSNSYPEGHSWGLWRATYDEILIELFPPGLTNVFESKQVVQDVKLSPNPVLENTISFEIPVEKLDQVELYSSTGQLIKSWLDVRDTTLDLPALSNGMYYLKLSGEAQVWVGKFVKDRFRLIFG